MRAFTGQQTRKKKQAFNFNSSSYHLVMIEARGSGALPAQEKKNMVSTKRCARKRFCSSVIIMITAVVMCRNGDIARKVARYAVFFFSFYFHKNATSRWSYRSLDLMVTGRMPRPPHRCGTHKTAVHTTMPDLTV